MVVPAYHGLLLPTACPVLFKTVAFMKQLYQDSKLIAHHRVSIFCVLTP